MHSNKVDDSTDWVLCPSKSIPGKFYYFNVANGEAVWSLDSKKPFKKDNIQQVADNYHSYPEPAPIKNNEASIGPTHHNSIRITTTNRQANIPTFGQSSLPKYIYNSNSSNSNMCISNFDMQIFGQTPKVVWAPIPLMVMGPIGSNLNQVPQTCELEKLDVHACELPLSKRFVNFENPVIKENKVENNIFTSTPLKQNVTLDSIITNDKISKKNLINEAILNINNLKLSNETNSLDTPKNTFVQNNTEKGINNFDNPKKLSFQNYARNGPHCLDTSKRLFLQNNANSGLENLVTPKSFFLQNNANSELHNLDTLKSLFLQNNANSGLHNLDNPKKILLQNSAKTGPNNLDPTKNLFLQNNEKSEQNIFKHLQKPFGNLNLERKDKILGTKDKDQDLPKLGKDDLRLLLMARKRRNVEESGNGPSEKKKINLKSGTEDVVKAPKKRVTFATNRPENVDNNNYNECSLTVRSLRHLAEANKRLDCWYIVVDSTTLLENYQFINDLVLSDPSCRLLIPESVRKNIISLCSGDSFGRKHVYSARQIARSIADPPTHVCLHETSHAGPSIGFYNDTNMATNDDILNCCLETIDKKYHLVLLSNDEDLLKKAASLYIHANKFEKIKEAFEKPNSAGEFNTTDGIFSTPGKDSIFQNIPKLMAEVPVDVHKSLFDDDSTTSGLTFVIDRVIQDLDDTFEIQNLPADVKNKPLIQNIEKRTIESIKQNILEENRTQNMFKNLKLESVVIPNGNENVPDSNIGIDDTKSVEMSVDNLLKRFYIKSKVMEERIKKRLEEWMCIFSQIMEDALCYVLQISPFRTDLVLPWTFLEMIDRVTCLYREHTTMVVIAKKLTASITQCRNDRGKIKSNIKPHDFIKAVGCGVLLVQYLTCLQPNREELANAERSLTNLLRTLEDPTEIQYENSMKDNKCGTKTENRYNYVKQPSDIIQYLKQHYDGWKKYDETAELDVKRTSNQGQKIFEITGRNLNKLKIHNNKTMTVTKCPNNADKITETEKSAGPKTIQKPETENKKKTPEKMMLKDNISKNEFNFKTHDNTFDTLKSGQKVTRSVNVIKEFEEKLRNKTPIDVDLLAYSEIDNRNGKNNNDEKHRNDSGIDDIVNENTDITNLIKEFLNTGSIKTKIDNDSGLNKNIHEKQYISNPIRVETTNSRKIMTYSRGKEDNGLEKDYISISSCSVRNFDSERTNVIKNDYERTKVDNNNSERTKTDKNDSKRTKANKNDSEITKVDKNNSERTQTDKNDSEGTKAVKNNFKRTKANKNDSERTKVDNNDSEENKNYKIDYISISDDSGVESESQMTYSLVKTFLSELSSTFIAVHSFISENIKVLREGLAKEKKTELHNKVDKLRQHICYVIQQLKSIIARESTGDICLTALAKTEEAANDKRITNYRSVIRKCLEQAHLLHDALKLMRSVTAAADWDGNLSIHADSVTSSIRYLNIFE